METQFTLNEQVIHLELLQLIAQKLERLEQIICTEFIISKDTLNSKEAAKYLGIKKSWLDKLCSSNKLKYHTSGKLRYFKIEELDKHKMRYVVHSAYDDTNEPIESPYSFDQKCGLTSKRKY